MEKSKKELTATQKMKKYRAIQYTTFGAEFISILTPFIVMGGINYEEWFVNENGWKVGLGGALALALLGMAVFLVGKKKENESITHGYITLVLGWFMVAFIFVLLSSILDQMATIMLFGGMGLLGAFGLDIVSQNNKKKADMYKAAIEKVRGTTAEEEYKRQIEQEVKENRRKGVPIE